MYVCICMHGRTTDECHFCQSAAACGFDLRGFLVPKICYAWLRCISYSPVLAMQVIRVLSLSLRVVRALAGVPGAALNLQEALR